MAPDSAASKQERATSFQFAVMSVSFCVRIFERRPPSIDGHGFETAFLDDLSQDAEKRCAVIGCQVIEEFGIVGVGQRREFRHKRAASRRQGESLRPRVVWVSSPRQHRFGDYTNALKRIVKTPKLHFLDSGLLATTRELSFDRVKANRGEFGALLESFVFSEVMKLMTGSDLRLTPYQFRDQQMHEVDIVLERDDGTIVGIEVKATATVKSSDFAGLRTLAEACKDRFAFGVVLYDSGDLVPFDDKLAAAPLSCIWS